MREWKPGDVALVNDCTKPDAAWKPATCFAARTETTETVWILHDSGGKVWGSVSDARPLVVIDPEDREQVERLVRAWLSDYDGQDTIPSGGEIDSMQAALREIANPTPPKPEEPPAWSVAIVQSNTPFTRVAENHITPPYSACWFGEHPLTGERTRLTWGELHALGDVEVVGRGVTS